jgi:hypothetical protein
MTLNLVIGCEKLYKAMGRPKLDQATAELRVANLGYELISEYLGREYKSTIRCNTHGCDQLANMHNIFSGMRLRCCHVESMRARLSVSMVGAGNHFYGKTHTLAVREAASARMLASDHPFRGKPRPEYLTAALKNAITGKPRSDATRALLSEKAKARHGVFEYMLRKVSGGKTSGKPGVFYILQVGDRLKFGSATTTWAYRFTRLKQKYGNDIKVLARASVDNAGAYEAAMMVAHRSLWDRGEFFRMPTATLQPGVTPP